MPGKDSSKAIRIIKGTVTLIFLIALVFVPAGTLNWPEAWLFLILYLLSVGGVVIWLKKNDPDLLRERMSTKKDVKRYKKYVVLFFFFLILLVLSFYMQFKSITKKGR